MHRAHILHFTNGDAAVARLRAGGVEGRVVPWRDVLHDGPVPAEPLERLRETRAKFIAGRDWGALDAVRADFAERDAALSAAADEEETTLWFEHDLYDQLQLLQLLDHFADHPARYLTLAQASDDYLGRMPPDAVRTLWDRRRPVTPAQLGLAREAWAAFRAPDAPRALEAMLARDTSALPHLAAAIRRLLEELPGTRDGLGRTERSALRAIAGAAPTLGDVFRAVAAEEPAIWLGDASFAAYLESLGTGPHPLVTFDDDTPIVAPHAPDDGSARVFWQRRAILTPLGARVLAGEGDRVAERGIDRWIGGAHLRGNAVRWRWDGGRVVAGEERGDRE